MIAYQGKKGCKDGYCRHIIGGDGYSGTCYGYHCANCDRPSSMYGHYRTSANNGKGGFVCNEIKYTPTPLDNGWFEKREE